MEKQRPSPDKFLKQAKEEEIQEKRGKLKIYLGAAPGVGKTYSMLQDAQAKRAQGLDIVVGVAEAHGRKEILDLIKGFEILPPGKLEYHGKQLSEFDLNAALKRNPALILIDELAHTNAPGSLHAKRWQDIKEILDRGIDVYTTLNVQHIESLNDIIAQITRIHVRETVPDFMLELADTIELVDLAPDDLIKRLQEGKVYIPEQIELAKQNFFRKGNLASLRELALRVTADRVDAQLLLYRQGQGIKHIWPATERILVCVGPGARTPKIIRAARRMASRLQSEWIAVYVETPKLNLSEDEHNKAIQNIRLAEQLGAETNILYGTEVLKEILNFARERNVTKIVIGKRIRTRWKDRIFGNLVDELVRNSGEIDIYIIHGSEEVAPFHKKHYKKTTTPFKYYIYTIGIVIIATAINFLFYGHCRSSILVLNYILGIVIVALYGRSGPSILAAVSSILLYDFLFVSPRFSFVTEESHPYISMILMLIISLIIGHLTIISRKQAELAGVAETHASALHVLSRELASNRGLDKILFIATRYISETFESEVMILLPNDGQLNIRARYQSTQLLNTKEQSIARWVYELGQMAGLGTDTLSSSEALFVPLLSSHGTVGVLRVLPSDPERLIIPEQMHFLEACANQVAVAIEIDHLQEQAKKSEFKIKTDQVRNALLQSVSHDLRAPLIAIMGNASTLSEMGKELDKKNINKLSNQIYLNAEQLNRLINNLLQMTYLEAESVKLQKENFSLQETIDSAIKTLHREIGKRTIKLTISPDLPLIPFDKTLIQQVLENLIDNALKFTPTKTPIEISVQVEKDKAIISIEDEGPGITPDEVDKLFEKFYRGRLLISEHGLGLGLALCRAIVEAHGGKIWAENRTNGGGAAFKFTIPLA